MAPSSRHRKPATEADAGADRADRRMRSLEEPLSVRRVAGAYPRLEVRNPIHATHYLVLLPAYPQREAAMCTCADFARRGLGTCKHLEAAWRWLQGHPEAVADPRPARLDAGRLWAEIDRSRRAAEGKGSDARRIRRGGDVLLSNAPDREN